EKCCNDNGITKQTFYNIKKRLDKTDHKQSPKKNSSLKSHIKYEKKYEPKVTYSGSRRRSEIEDMEIELVPSNEKPKNQIKNDNTKQRAKFLIDNLKKYKG